MRKLSTKKPALNLEGDTADMLEASTPIPMDDTDLIEMEMEVIVDPLTQLSNSFDTLCQVVNGKDILEQAGTNAELVAQSLAPIAATAIELVSGEEYVANDYSDHAIALEADGGKSFWLKVKEKALAIWAAIVENAKRFFNWFTGLFKAKKLEQVKINAQLDVEEKALDTLIVTAAKRELSPAELEKIEARLKGYLAIEAMPHWAIDEKGWTASQLIPDMQYFIKNIVVYTKKLVQAMQEQTRMSELMLTKLRQSSLNQSASEALLFWKKEEENSLKEESDEWKYANSDTLIGYKRTATGFVKNTKATGVITFSKPEQLKVFIETLRQYGVAAVSAMQVIATIEEPMNRVMESVKRGLNNYQPDGQDFDDATMMEILQSIRNVMFKQIHTLKKYSMNNVLNSQRNGVSLVQAMRLQHNIKANH